MRARTGNAIERPCQTRHNSSRAPRRRTRAACHTERVTNGMAAVRARARAALANSGFDDVNAEVDALLAAVLDRTRGEVALDALLDRPVAPAAVAAVDAALARRARREPLQHLTRRAPFGDLELHVGPGVFVPRPETERLVELALATISSPAPAVVDLGSGSGAVAIGLARSDPSARVWAVESSPHAWPWLVRNAREFGCGRVVPVFGRMGEVALPGAPFALDAVLSNPPYIPRADEPRDPEVRLFDPSVALYGGVDGLDDIRGIVTYAARRLVPGGIVLLEHDERQGDAIRGLLADTGFVDQVTERDLAGRDRLTGARAPVPGPAE